VYPTELNHKTARSFFGPLHAQIKKNSSVTASNSTGNVVLDTAATGTPDDTDIRISSVLVSGDRVFVYLVDANYNPLDGAPGSGQAIPSPRDFLTFRRPDGSATTVQMKIMSQPGTVNKYEVYTDVHNYEAVLPFFNAYSFGNGVESNRVRDDYNQIFIDKGPKVSAVLEEPYAEEHRSSGFIYSGIYNSMSGVNNLNQFIQAEKITKDLNPSYGSIQKLFARNTDLVTFCEDKVFKILANKDALFNADGNPQLTATENVLGQTVPFAGDYGISTDPESFAYDNYRLYFSDRTRGNILRLSQDGITSISSYGMSKWFADNLPDSTRVIGSFDDKKKEYNVHLNYFNYDSLPVGILGSPQVTLQVPGAPPPPLVYIPSNVLTATYKEANKINVGDTIYGPGILVGTVVTSKIALGGGLWKINISQTPDISILGNPVAYGPQTVGVVGDAVWQTNIYSSKDDKDPYTLSYSEKSKGWPSFKSFHFENGLSLNNEYFTFKNGLLYQHHTTGTRRFLPHNNFYGEQYDSSVEVIFNEEPGSVKSFQTVDYEGTQSKVTADIDNSGEYWDNYEKTGWYIDNMYTNLQEVEPAEFKNKEGKWFSTVKGVHTEWLNDGAAGNIDTREFSYQGIDENSGLSVVGNYTSWDCEKTTGYIGACCVDDNGNSLPIYPSVLLSNPPATPTTLAAAITPLAYQIQSLLFDNPAILVNNNVFEYDDGTAGTIWCSAYGGSAVVDGSVFKNSQLQPFVDMYSNPGQIIGGTQYSDIIDFQPAPPWLGDSYTVTQEPYGTKKYFVMYTTINYLVQWCSTYLDSNVFYLGMSFHDWFNAITGPGGLGAVPNQFVYSPVYANTTTACAGGGVQTSYNCVERQDAFGAYVDEAQCNNDVTSQCNTNCSVPNLVTVHPVNGINPTFTNATCTGSVSVEVYLSGTATSWNVHYEDMSGTVVLVDNTTYTVGGQSSSQQLNDGTYVAVVKDNLNCTEKREFVISCASPPCPQSPGAFSLTGTKPTWNTSLGRCWEIGDPGPISNSGSFDIVNLGLTAPATSWGYELYLEGPTVAGIPILTLISSQSATIGGLAAGTGITVTGLEEGMYRLRYTDDTGCPYLATPLQLACVDICIEDIYIDPTNGEDIDPSAASPCSLGGIDTNQGAHEILQIVLPSTWTSSNSYTVQYYSYPSGTIFTQATATPIGNLQGPYTSASSLNGGIGYMGNLPSSITSGNDYAIIWTDDLGCESMHRFSIDCVDNPPCSAKTNPTSTYTVTNSTSIECASHDNGDGAIVINTVSLQSAATSFDIVFGILGGTGITVIQGYYNEPTPATSSFVASNLAANTHLPAGANGYYYTITDNLGCQQTVYPVVQCDFANPAQSCSNGGTYVPDAQFESFLESRGGAAGGVNNTDISFAIPGQFTLPAGVPYVPTNNSGINPLVANAQDMGNQIWNDKCVTTNRINWVTHLDMGPDPTTTSIQYPRRIVDLTGIEDFINLTHLNVAENLIKEIDLTSNTNLVTVNAAYQHGGKGIVDVYYPSTYQVISTQTNTWLGWPNWNPNHDWLTSVNVNGLNKLKYLNLNYNCGLTSLDVTTNTALEVLFLTSAQISNINLTNNLELRELIVSSTLLTTLDLSNNDKLEQIMAIRQSAGTHFSTGYWWQSTINPGFSIPHLTDVYISPNQDLTNLKADLCNSVVLGQAHENTTVHVGVGDVPGTSGGTGAGGQQTRVEYCESVRSAGPINLSTPGGSWSVHASVTFVA